MTKQIHMELLSEILEQKSNDQDQYVLHQMLMDMMEEDGFEIDYKILKEIATEKPEVAEDIQELKDIVKDVRNAIILKERLMTPY